MPKEEEPIPWAATSASLADPYPRKNVYFSDKGGDEVYDFCIWQAHVRGHTTLRGFPARGASGFIRDVLARVYVNAMLDAETRKAYTEWRTTTYERNGQSVTASPPQPERLMWSTFVPALDRFVEDEDLEREYLNFVRKCRARLRERQEPAS